MRICAMPPKICGSCGSTYDGASWTALCREGRMKESDMSGLVVGWTASREIDIRRCARCNAVLARLIDLDRDA